VTRRDAERLLTWWAARLAPAWRVTIDWGSLAPPPNSAQVKWSDDYEIATIELCLGWLDTHHDNMDNPDLEREVDLVHEVVHVCQQPGQLAFFSLQASLPPGLARQLALDRYKHDDERQCERISRLLVGLRHGRGAAV